MSGAGDLRSAGAQPAIRVTYQDPDGTLTTARFTSGFTIGRGAEHEVVVQDLNVSREHARVTFEDGSWVLRDLNSTNGTLVHDRSITRQPIARGLRARLGSEGPVIELEVEGSVSDPSGEETVLAPLAAAPSDLREAVQRYLDDDPGREVGEHTALVRNVIAGVRRRESRRYVLAVGIIGTLLLAALGVVIYQELRLADVEKLAITIFYDMKELEIEVARLQEVTRNEELLERRTRLRSMMSRYQQLVEKSSVFTPSMSREERLILKVARVFGECELNVPRDFLQEVQRYIAEWQSSRRLPNAIRRLQRRGYTARIRELLEANGLPPQFGFVALQESNFDVRAVGPETRFGFAKGMWQFIPGTASDYGLRVGPGFEQADYDPLDERFDFDKSTHAAARYLRDIYMGEAQASGLLVLASYNWGHNRVRRLIKKMPENPRERNFWNLLKRFKIPQETYDYVFMIFSAAVIAEDPQLFDFDFENPFGPARSASIDGHCLWRGSSCYR